jgi:2',3'-cyclic-nucleotide 2'-phosphodiesterase (5'-nucleotidase family)
MQILHDVFPAHVALAASNTFTDVHQLISYPNNVGTYYIQTARVIVTDTNITIAADAPEGPQIVFNERYTFFEKAATPETDSYVITESGKMLAYKKDVNCGCGSRLRSWNPYKTLTSNRDPIA